MAEIKNLQLYLGIAGAASAVVAVVLYFENKEKRKIDKEIAMHTLQIKKLDLSQKKDKAVQFGTA